MVDVENSSRMTVSTASGEDTNVSSFVNQGMPLSVTVPPPKKRRNLPGMPDPDAEVVALSPNFLLATNRFVCEICNKGFQRDQNLQLHRRGHNLPWKLKQRTNKEPRKRVYVCPEPSCVHHSPVRALGDLTGIKKHFSRKHGEKKWKCERCSKKYAVQSDCKAHMKTCGTREYKCDCGTLFSRRDSFITHRAFCDALTGKEGDGYNIKCVVTSPPPPPLTPSTSVVSPGLSVQSSEVFKWIRPENMNKCGRWGAEGGAGLKEERSRGEGGWKEREGGAGSEDGEVEKGRADQTHQRDGREGGANHEKRSRGDGAPVPAAIPRRASPPSAFPMFCGLARSDCPPTMPARRATEPPSLSLSTSVYLSNTLSSPFPADQDHRPYTPSPQPAMSATALLQKAAQMDNKTTFAAGLGLVLPSCDVMMNSFSLLGNKPTTLDLLGLGMDAASSALLNSYGTGGFNVGEAAAAAAYGGGGRGNSEESWDGVPERKPNGSAASSLKSSI
ncbi:hypothetical protein OIU77_011202 [Salix suchowensis]|uniref:C2H2-type domain-containing protein n=1 Tax=Salix suchowensis TaxID=1278906 RepID=A0ABQ9AAZ0_9ROSI|nr:hypothetical protein OIU77_011202 [Salix suchowensis]